MNDGEKRFRPLEWVKKKIENFSTPKNSASFVIPQEHLDGLKDMVDDQELREKTTPLIKEVISDLQDRFPWIKRFSTASERLDNVLNRVVHISRGELHNFVITYLKGLGAKNLENSHLQKKSVNAGIYLGFGDFIALSVDPDENEKDEEDNKLTIAEEILHYLQPFNPIQIASIKDSMMVNHLNEGVTLYYKTKLYPDFKLFEEIKNPSNRQGSGNVHYFISIIWKTWVEEYGEDRMAACYFGKRKFPRKVINAINNGLTSEMLRAASKIISSD